MQQRRRKGLCFNCDEKFTLGHKCKKQQLFQFLIEPEQEFREEYKERLKNKWRIVSVWSNFTHSSILEDKDHLKREAMLLNLIFNSHKLKIRAKKIKSYLLV